MSNSVMILVDQRLRNTFALVYTLRTPDMWVTLFSPKKASLTSFFYLFFRFRSFRSNNSTNSKHLLIFYFSVFISDHFNSIVRRKVSIIYFNFVFLFQIISIGRTVSIILFDLFMFFNFKSFQFNNLTKSNCQFI